jgi:replicative DNA helicase
MIIDLLKYLGDRNNYDKCIKYVKTEYLPKEAVQIIEYLPKYFSESGNTIVSDWTDLLTRMGMLSSIKIHELLPALIETLHTDITPINTETMQMFTNRMFAEQLADEAIKVAEGKSNSFLKIQDVLDTYKRTSVRLEKDLLDVGVEDMFASLSSIKTSGFKWGLDCLNQMLGPLNSEFILLASRPDGGKTTLLAFECWNIAKQLKDGKQIIWFNNEEHIRNVKLRVIQSFLGMKKDDVLADIVTAVKRFDDEFGKDRIIFVDDSNHITKVEKVIDKYNPGLIIVDQLYKVQGMMGGKQELEAERFRKLCEWARDIAKHVCPVMASNQLDGKAEGVKYPTMDSLYGSKTGAQGEADAILFIGKTPVDGDNRFLYTPKNKLTGSNEHFEVLLQKEIARYRTL